MAETSPRCRAGSRGPSRCGRPSRESPRTGHRHRRTSWSRQEHGRPAAREPARVSPGRHRQHVPGDRKSTRLNSSHVKISYAVFCLKKKKKKIKYIILQINKKKKKKIH